MNSVAVTGRLTRDPELQERGGTTVCDLRVAVDNGQYDPTFVDVTTFNGQAEACAKYLAKGRQVAVAGRLHHSEWEAADGSKRSRHSIVGRVEFIGAPQRESAPDAGSEDPEAASQQEKEEIPF